VSVLALLIMASLAMGITFLIGFIWAVRSGQYEDTCTPSMRILTEEAGQVISPSTDAEAENHGLVPPVQTTTRFKDAKIRPVTSNGRVVP
jgi:cbb3-type cytochrome oxidase maturation protein